MLAKRVIACLDIDAGRVVKGRRFVEIRDAGDPVTLAARYCEQGADEILVLDISATRERRLASQATIERIARVVDVPLCVGGGVRGLDDVRRLLDAGADKVSINSAAITNPFLLRRAAARYGAQCVVLSIDARKTHGARSGYEIATHGATVFERRTPVAWAARGEALGAGEILLTSIDRDGVASGFDLELTQAVSAAVGIPVIASGGARDAGSFVDVYNAGADAALAASLFHYGGSTVAGVKSECARAGVRVRQ
jgi:cyclase